MKIHIFFDFADERQESKSEFLRALRDQWIEKECYALDPLKADVILFDSEHRLLELSTFKYFHPQKTFIHRIDAPQFLVNKADSALDQYIFQSNHHLSDGTVFQSPWSRQQCLEAGLRIPDYEITLINAPDPTHFFPPDRRIRQDKIYIITNCCGVDGAEELELYQYLDEHLEFHRFDMSIVGLPTMEFKRINNLGSLSKEKFGAELRKHHIYFAGRRKDPCCNALIEALHCGLPGLVLNDGGHPYILEETGGSGLTFEGKEDVLERLDEIADNLEMFRQRIDPPRIDEIAERYYHFSAMVKKQREHHKSFNFFKYVRHQLRGRKLRWKKILR